MPQSGGRSFETTLLPVSNAGIPCDCFRCSAIAAVKRGIAQSRQFSTGATRDADSDKLDYEGFLSPLALQAFARYMHKHRRQADGSLRASDNWAKGIPRREYCKSLWRHFLDVWMLLRGYAANAKAADLEEALCACLFNVQGLLHEVQLERDCGDGPAKEVGGSSCQS